MLTRIASRAGDHTTPLLRPSLHHLETTLLASSIQYRQPSKLWKRQGEPAILIPPLTATDEPLTSLPVLRNPQRSTADGAGSLERGIHEPLFTDYTP